ncbi:MAG: ribosomal protein L11 methyltransferase [Herpetosiphonaceae bacterium]|nr:MAG: ribosomal protein L11 methyltransferase [Herpetosiphonaceae bacterium]
MMNPTGWLELSVDVDREAVESVGALLAEIGYNSGVVVEEPIIHGPDGPDYQVDQSRPVTMRTYLPNDERASELIGQVERGLWALGMLRTVGELRVRELAEDDWANNWKAYYRPHRIGNHILVVPSWEEIEPQPGDIVLRLDPGMAFGTGLHPTTQLCLELIERYTRPGITALDLGSGSGILTIALAKLGARVVALDNDPIAVAATRENVARNQVHESVVVAEGSLGAGFDAGHWMGWNSGVVGQRTEAAGQFDMIVANILARVHVALAQDYRKALRSGAEGELLITSGIIAERELEVAAALAEAGFVVVERRQEGDWVAFVHRLSRH